VAHNSQATVFSGTSSAPGRVRVIDDDRSEIAPGAAGRVELRLGAPLAVVAGDALVLRRPAPAGTIAGGHVDLTHPPRYARRRGRWLETEEASSLEERLVATVRAYLDAHPARSGMPRAEVPPGDGMSRRGLAGALDRLAASGALAQDGGLLAIPGWQPRLTATQSAAAARVLARLGREPMSPPRTGELVPDGLDDDVRRYLEEQELVVRVAPDLLMLPGAVAEAESRLRAHIRAQGGATVSQARDALASSRRTVVPLLEYFDAVRLTRRVGDVRVLAG
jgi:selenocysteine-specific elongation factor